MAELEGLAAELSLMARPGAVILLSGELGAGKSTFARAFIRALADGGEDFEVPSPTFTLVQTYTETRLPVAHADLYRLGSAAEADELGLDELAKSHVLLVEWPGRRDWQGFADVLEVALAGSGPTRRVGLTARGSWEKALRRNAEINVFLAGSSFTGATRRFLEGDASFRRYEVLERNGTATLLMDMPARPDGPPVKHGLPYSAIAHLAEDISTVVAINGELVSRGYSAPRILASDLTKGLAVIEDLGRAVYGRLILEGHDMAEPMAAAVEVLAHMARQDWPSQVAAGPSRSHIIPPYDEEAQIIEADLLPSWFWPHLHGTPVPETLRADYEALWREVLPLAKPQRPLWTLRDYHSPNLIWMPERQGLARVGLIDTQDCVLGHPAYDLASLLQDARVDLDAALTAKAFEHYCALRAGEPDFNRSEFETAFAILGAQRASKILGIFARLARRDGKPGYIRHMPRVASSLAANLRHPSLARLRGWFTRHLPQALAMK
ncbi:MAG: tRNA (adenosine(37)-N6)-threonylcarbamoyltransferase complex ATPase subunit type 1 TsaE [Rhizobiales bacterium]|nr:tRNA (adenosine(37)-N6)-threonylcarbamoyltransferase complex ATPase subunit type 1 TsaE [Hyphomicrobiales bacterium]MBI3672424.1 tRNA (adenosine(37)-N6)-threonylcarbamoyltransferase complex ATPase subunit type 1 TsaE [Hyphomicrobiales bacterium]